MNNFNIINRRIGILGKTCSGKSVMLKYIVSKYKKEFKKTFVICPTECINSFYSDMVPANCIFDNFSEEWTTDLIKNLTEYKKNNKEILNVLLILDDCGSDAKFVSSKAFRILCTRGRHLNITLIVTMQYIYQIPPACRSNLDFLIVGQMNHQATTILCDEYLMGSIDRKEFLKIYHNAIKDYGFLLINCNSVKDTDDLNSIYGIIKTPIQFVK